MIFFCNFLALMIKAGVAHPEDSSTEVFAVILVIVNICFFLSIWWNAYASARVMCSLSHVQMLTAAVEIQDMVVFASKSTRTAGSYALAGSCQKVYEVFGEGRHR